MNTSFPQDRSLFSAPSAQADASVQLPWAGTGAQPAMAIAFAALLVFYRTQSQDILCIKVLPGEGQEGFYACARFGASDTLGVAWAGFTQSAGYAVPPDNVPVLDLLLCEASLPDSATQAHAQQPVLRYRLQQPTPDQSQLHLTLQYPQQLLAPLTATDFLEKIGLIMVALADQPQVAINALALGTASSARLIPNIALPLPAHAFATVAATFFAVAERHAEQPAIVGNDQRYTYGFLKDQTIGLMNQLQRAGVAVGDVVCIHGASCPGTIASILAVLGVGGVLVIIDHLLPDERKKLIADISQARFTIAVGAQGADTVLPSNALHTEDWPRPTRQMPAVSQAPLAEAAPQASAYIFFTSGSSGVPKGVLGTHLGLSHFLDWQRSNFPMGPGHRTAQLTALSFDVVLRDLLYPLTSGACIHIPRRDTLLDARKMLAWLEQERITAMHCVPSLMRAWLLADTGKQPFKHLQTIFFAGEPLSDALLRRFQAAASPNTQITNLYGPTETTLAKLFNRIEHIEDGIQPVGNAQPGVDVVILKDRQTLCGLWETGEIAIRTPYRSNGYFQNPALTQEVFVPNPLRQDPQDLVYLTGDLGRYRSDGKVEIFGRIDAQIKIRGVRIEPNEIESCILSLPGMKDAAVTTRVGASGDKVLLAVVVPQSMDGFDTVEQARLLREQLKERLHDAMVPARIVFQQSLPYLPNGKLDRKSIGAIEFGVVAASAGKAASPLQMDDKLASVVAGIEEALGIQIDDLDKSFVDLGGDSLSFIRVSMVVEDTIGWLPDGWEQLPLRKLTAQAKEASRHFNSAGSTIVARALCIVMVLVEHFQLLAVASPTTALFVISGWSLGKYQLTRVLKENIVTPILRTVLYITIPATLLTAFTLLKNTRSLDWPTMLMVNNYSSKFWVDGGYWFINVLVHSFCVLALLFAIPQVRQRFRQNTYGAAIAATLVCMLMAAVGHVLQDGQPIASPIQKLWLLFLGVAMAYADTPARRMQVALLAIGCAFDRTLVTSFAWFPLLVVWAVIAVPRVRLPALLAHGVNLVAGASLFIYICHLQFKGLADKTPLEGNAYAYVGAAVVGGIAIWQLWDRLFNPASAVVQRWLDRVRSGPQSVQKS